MIFSNGEQEHEVKGLYPVEYQSELADGVLVDMEGCSVFLSAHVESHREIIDEITDEDTEDYDMTDCEVDWDVKPHSWVLKSLSTLIVSSCEEMLEE